MKPDIKTAEDLAAISLSPKSTVQDVVRLFATHKPAKTGFPAGIALVVGKDNVLLGIITHGDLNRALADSISFDAPVTEIMNAKPFVIEGPLSNTEIIALVTSKVRDEQLHKTRLEKIIIVDAKKRVLNVLSFFDVWHGSDVSYKRIGVLGLGYVGLTLGLTFADLGFDVHAFDTNPEVKKKIKAKQAPFFEDGLPPLLRQYGGNRFKMVDNFDEKNKCEVYFIAVGTPLDAKKRPQLDHLKAATNTIGGALKRGDLVVLRSTVPLGTTRSVVIPLLEKKSGLVAGEDFFVAFAPERTIEGKALQELRTLPQVIGGINRASATAAAALFGRMTNSTLIVDTLEEAEMVKLINNTYRDVMFGFANEVSLICQKWGIDTNEVIRAANMGYPRSNVPKPSPGVGGYCLEKDPYILMHGAREKGYIPNIARSARQANEDILTQLGDDVLEFLGEEYARKKQTKIFVLGFAFKGRPATSDMRGSTTVALVRKLTDMGYTNIHGFDPVVAAEQIEALGVKHVKSPAHGFKDAAVVLVMNNHEDFERFDLRTLLKKGTRSVLFIDTWALFEKDALAHVPNVTYRRL